MRDWDEKGSVYALVDPRTDEVRYIGQTSGELEKRLKEHISDAMSPAGVMTNPRKAQWIRELAANGHRPAVRLLKQERVMHLVKAETDAITEHLKAGCDLVNAPIGSGWIGTPQPMVVAALVSDDTYFALYRRARAAGMSLNTYVRRVLEQHTLPDAEH